MRRLLGIAGALLTPFLVVGCAAEESVELHPSAFVGSSIAQLENALPEETAYVVYDVSLPVAGEEAQYGTPDAGTNNDWLIVVACYGSVSLAVGVVNGEDYTEEIADSAHSGRFDDLLLECGTD